MIRKEFLRFLVVGGANTLFSLCVYWALVPFMRYGAAYSISFVAGVLSGFALNTYLVFRVKWSWTKLFAFPLVHLVNYLLGLLVIWLAIEIVGADRRWAPIVAVAVTTPVNFLLTRMLIRRGAPAEETPG